MNISKLKKMIGRVGVVLIICRFRIWKCRRRM